MYFCIHLVEENTSWDYQLECNENEMVIRINPQTVGNTYFKLNDESCVSNQNDTHIEIKTGYHACGTIVTEDDAMISFENTAVSVNQDGIISRDPEYLYPMICAFPRTFNTSLKKIEPTENNNKVIISEGNIVLIVSVIMLNVYLYLYAL